VIAVKKRKKKPKLGSVIPKKPRVGRFYVEGTFGRVDMPTSQERRYSPSIMAREIAKLTTKRINARFAMRKEDKPGMLALAEASCTYKQICAVITREAERAMVADACNRSELVKHLEKFCDGQFWADFHRKRTIEQIAARVFRRRRYT
jgi:hypothetical protein